jgi:hypothetical protein
MPRWREILGLIMLSLGGYLNLSTDVLLSARLLHPEQALDYAFWSRLLFTQWALVGLAVQVRYPFWASPSLSFSAVLAEIRKAYWPLLLGSAALLLAYLVNRQMQFIGHGALLPLWMFAVMALNAYVCCITSLLGQTLIVRNVYSFVRPSIAISCCSPLAALAIGHLVSPQSFVVGYLLANLLLFAVVFKASRDHLRSQ